MTTSPELRIGSRASPLARFQAEAVRAALAAAHPGLAAPGAIELRTIRTTGDKERDRALAEIGGKGLFTKEIEEALLAGAIDLAVHSMKDMPTWPPEGLVIAGQLAREDPRDALIANGVGAIEGLAAGAIVGTASPRRTAQLLMRRPDLRVVLFRGNVHTRLRKLAAGEVDATLLAVAGLKRLGMMEKAGASVLDPSVMLPAVGQGAICIECRARDDRVRALVAPINHAPTEIAVVCERAMLAALDGSCRTPIAGYAVLDGDGGLHLRGLVVRPDGGAAHRASRRGPASDAAALGADVGRELKAAAGPGFFDEAG